MSRPSTNWRPISFIAWPATVRITGSPKRLSSLRRVSPTVLRSESFSRLLVINKATVAVLISDDDALPTWLPQAPDVILSSISSWIVVLSGTRNSASARHIRATPSLVVRPYSARNFSMMVDLAFLRTLRTRPAARAEMASRSVWDNWAPAIISWITLCSSARMYSRIACRLSPSSGVSDCCGLIAVPS